MTTLASAVTPVEAAHRAVDAAEAAVLTEVNRSASAECWARLASAFEQRSAAWRALAAVSGPGGRHDHTTRAMLLVADYDQQRAAQLRQRLGLVRR